MTTIAASTISPGVSLAVNLAAGQQSPGSAVKRGLLLGVKATTGTGTVDTLIYSAVPDAVTVMGYAGPGSPAHLAAKRIFEEYPLVTLDLLLVTEASGNAATATLTFDDTSPVTAAQSVTLDVIGRQIAYTWPAGLAKVPAATAFVALLAQQDEDLPVVATNGGGTLAVVTLTFKTKGTVGNDVLLYLTGPTGGTGGAVTLSSATLTGGTTVPDPTTALQTAKGVPYWLIANTMNGNTDADGGGSSTGVGKVDAYILANGSGFAAMLQQQIVGVTGTLSGAKTGTATLDSMVAEYLFCRSARSLPAEFCGAELGARLREESLDPAVNRNNRFDAPYKASLFGPQNLTSGALLPSEIEDALQSGLSPCKFTSTGKPYVAIARTTYWKDGNGAPDKRVLFVSQVSGTYAVALDLVTFLPARFPGSKLVQNQVQGDDELPPNVVDEATVLENVIARVRTWQRLGVVDKAALDKSIADGTFYCKVDPLVDSKLNLQIPLKIVRPLTQFDVAVLGS